MKPFRFSFSPLLLASLLTLLLPGVSFTFDSAFSHHPYQDDFIYDETLKFKEFHDPGYIITEDGREIEFHYIGITYENISSWEEGRKIELRFHPTEGDSLYDPESKASAYILDYRPDEHPIDLIKNKCSDGSTAEMVECFSTSQNLWNAELERVYKKLEATVDRETFSKIKNMHKEWVQFKELKSEVNKVIYTQKKGTISIIESANRSIEDIRAHVLYLRSLLNDSILKKSWGDEPT